MQEKDIDDVFNEWKANVTNKKLMQELDEMEHDADKKQNAFYTNLEFGTAGMRGIMGAGTNCMNEYTVKQISIALARYLIKNKLSSVVVSCDSRNNSRFFSKIASNVFCKCGLKVYLSKNITPCPCLSFAVRTLKCDAGIYITASHNAAQYNGYKVFNGTGCQISENVADEIASERKQISMFETDNNWVNKNSKNKIIAMPNTIVKEYKKEICKCGSKPEMPISICYTPLNGAGYKIMPQILKMSGYNNVHIVREQYYPNGDFKTCVYPNPEKQEALYLGIKLAKQNQCDLLIATDPDADRVGAAVNHNGEMVMLSGNDVAVLITNYLLSTKVKSKDYVVIKSIVTSALVNKVATKFNATVIDVLTGFKNIGEQINYLENNNNIKNFCVGVEDSCGYLVAPYVRDKDGISAGLVIAEMVAFYKKQNKTLIDVLTELNKELGEYNISKILLSFVGEKGVAKMNKLMASLRNNFPTEICGFKIIQIQDYLTQKVYDKNLSIKLAATTLPKANVIIINFENNSQIIIRPSGTEPILKVYITVVGSSNSTKEQIKMFENFIKTFFA